MSVWHYGRNGSAVEWMPLQPYTYTHACKCICVILFAGSSHKFSIYFPFQKSGFINSELLLVILNIYTHMHIYMHMCTTCVYVNAEREKKSKKGEGDRERKTADTYYVSVTILGLTWVSISKGYEILKIT